MNAKRFFLGLVLLDFSGLTAYAIWQYGVDGVVQQMFANAVATTLTVDLTIALSMVVVWMWQDARDRGLSPIPYALLTLGLGSVGPLLYLMRRDGAERPRPVAQAFGTLRA